MNNTPLTVDEYEKLFTMLDLLLSRNLERLLNHGAILTENGDDERISSSQRKIHQYRENIRREQEKIQRIRKWLQHKRAINSH